MAVWTRLRIHTEDRDVCRLMEKCLEQLAVRSAQQIGANLDATLANKCPPSRAAETRVDANLDSHVRVEAQRTEPLRDVVAASTDGGFAELL